MASVNKKISANKNTTHEGGNASNLNNEQMLRRSVMSCFLWEDGFYENGESIASRISQLIPKVSPEKVAQIAIAAREIHHLRHVPLLIVRVMASLPTHKHLVALTLERVIQRADEIAEFMAIYWKDGKCPISNQVKVGLGNAFKKFSEYDLAKYNRDRSVRLSDVLKMVRPKPDNDAQQILWKKLLENRLEVPDTWEVELSKGGDKRESWTRLLTEKKMGSLAILRNIRNFKLAGVDNKIVRNAILEANHSKTLPFRFIAAAQYGPEFVPALETSLFASVAGYEKLKGDTVVLVDVSGSMYGGTVSQKSDLKVSDAASGVAIIAREICENARVFTFSNREVEVPAYRGFALANAIEKSQGHNGTYLAKSLQGINATVNYDRLIVITDEQTADGVLSPKCDKAYIINVAQCQNGVGYGKYIHINGFSEGVIKYIMEIEKENG